jgi:hypothetical protein
MSTPGLFPFLDGRPYGRAYLAFLDTSLARFHRAGESIASALVPGGRA